MREGRKEGRGEGWRMVEIEGRKGDMDRVRKEGGEDKGRGEGSMKRRQEEGWSFFLSCYNCGAARCLQGLQTDSWQVCNYFGKDVVYILVSACSDKLYAITIKRSVLIIPLPRPVHTSRYQQTIMYLYS